MDDKRRIYPLVCTSGYCGGSGEDCSGCRYRPALDEFRAWVERTGAKPIDPIWSPLVYVVPAEVSHGTP